MRVRNAGSQRRASKIDTIARKYLVARHLSPQDRLDKADRSPDFKHFAIIGRERPFGSNMGYAAQKEKGAALSDCPFHITDTRRYQ